MEFQVGEVEIVWKRKQPTVEKSIKTSEDASLILRPFYSDCMEYREKFGVMYLNRANNIVGFHEISKGGTSSTTVDIKHIVQGAVLLNASSVILSHNHPSGSLSISGPDRKITTAIKNALTLLNVKVLDHIILTYSGYASMADELEL